MKTLPLTVLLHEGPMGRAYLAVLHAAGFKVERILRLVGKRDPARQRPIAPWLPSALRRAWARAIQEQQINHWPRLLLRQHRDLCRPWFEELARAWSIDRSVFECFTEPARPLRYADEVQELFVDGLADPVLADCIRSLPPRTALLYTGGGMVPASLLSAGTGRFLHVHPGHLPHVRGADGLLWSVLLRGRPGVTAFYMDAGLDTGDVVEAADFDVPAVPAALAQLDVATAYRLLYTVLDPMLRALLLRQVVQRQPYGLAELPSAAQHPGVGNTFHFMNPRLRAFAIRRLVELAQGSTAAVA